MYKDESGNRYGNLVVQERVISKDKSGAWWRCVCDCGNVIETSANKLRTGHTKSCGCRRKRGHITHGRSKGSDRTYKTWKEMRNRCNNPNAVQFKWYGGKGISVCDQWESFEVFIADMGERPEGKTLDRVNSDGDYEPENCRWATAAQQAENNRGCFRRGHLPWNKHPKKNG